MDLKQRWLRFWMLRAGMGIKGRFAARMASLLAPPYKGARELCWITPRGYVSPKAAIGHDRLFLGRYVFIDDHVTIYRTPSGGGVRLEDKSAVMRYAIIETDEGGTVRLGPGSWIHPGCKIIAALSAIDIGAGVMLAAKCALYPHNHGIEPGIPIVEQSCTSKGPIVIEDGAWLGTGVAVLGGVTIGRGAVIGAGAVVTRSIPAEAIAFGVPAKVVRYRGDAVRRNGE
jgi:acetyltransferase-like isoleucine patch superfamily enzyme